MGGTTRGDRGMYLTHYFREGGQGGHNIFFPEEIGLVGVILFS
jgi:hypothetical protein